MTTATLLDAGSPSEYGANPLAPSLRRLKRARVPTVLCTRPPCAPVLDILIIVSHVVIAGLAQRGGGSGSAGKRAIARGEVRSRDSPAWQSVLSGAREWPSSSACWRTESERQSPLSSIGVRTMDILWSKSLDNKSGRNWGFWERSGQKAQWSQAYVQSSYLAVLYQIPTFRSFRRNMGRSLEFFGRSPEIHGKRSLWFF